MKKKLLSISTKLSHYKVFTDNLLAIEMRKTQILMNKPGYLGLLMLDLSKTVMYKLLHAYVKPKYGENSKRCYINVGSLIVFLKADSIY